MRLPGLEIRFLCRVEEKVPGRRGKRQPRPCRCVLLFAGRIDWLIIPPMQQITIVIEDKLLHRFVSPAGVKVVILHLAIGASGIPALDRHPKDRRHRASTVASARAMDKHGPILFVIDQGQEFRR